MEVTTIELAKNVFAVCGADTVTGRFRGDHALDGCVNWNGTQAVPSRSR
jgi:hypothetical protein